MSAGSLGDGGTAGVGPEAPRDLLSHDFLRVVSLWSLIPAYLLAGGFFGYLLDRWLGTFPFAMGVGLIIALVLAVRDMMRMREEFGLAPKKEAER